MANKILLRRDTKANWDSVNPVLSNGEIGLETDTQRFKIGDGEERWTERSYYADADYIAAQYNGKLEAAVAAAETATAEGEARAAASATAAATASDAASDFANTAAGYASAAGDSATAAAGSAADAQEALDTMVSDMDDKMSPVLADTDSVSRGIIDGLFANAVPAGAMMMWPVPGAPPAGWIVADGTTKVRAEHPALFARYGTTFNTGGELATEFRLPNPLGRSPVGYDSSQTEFNTVGKLSGSKTKSVSIGTANLPSHTHTQTAHTHTINHGHTASSNDHDVNHYHGADTGDSGGHEHYYTGQAIGAIAASGGSSFYIQRDTYVTSGGGVHRHIFNTGWMSHNNTHGHSITVNPHSGSSGSGGGGETAATGSGTAMSIDVLQASFVVNYIIKDG